jgi:hypothetical protein
MDFKVFHKLLTNSCMHNLSFTETLERLLDGDPYQIISVS